MDGNPIEIPHEMVAQEGKRLKVGVYGVDADNNLVIPTLWANLGMIRAAAEPSGDPGTDPQLPVWTQIQSEVDALKASGMGGGIAVSGAAVGQTVKISAVDEHGVPTAWEPADFSECGGKTDYCIQEGEPSADDMPKVFLGAALPQTKDDTIMSFRYISKTRDISGWCKTKAQGDNSMSNPKKNQTVKLYKDAACTEKLKVNFKGWGEQNKFCFKANWEDLTHARNIVCARLWGEVVKNPDPIMQRFRNGFARVPIKVLWTVSRSSCMRTAFTRGVIPSTSRKIPG